MRFAAHPRQPQTAKTCHGTHSHVRWAEKNARPFASLTKRA